MGWGLRFGLQRAAEENQKTLRVTILECWLNSPQFNY